MKESNKTFHAFVELLQSVERLQNLLDKSEIKNTYHKQVCEEIVKKFAVFNDNRIKDLND